MHPDWLVPDWPAPANVKSVFTTRAGGVSRPPWDSLNLGDHVGDVPQQVTANRLSLSKALGLLVANRPVFLKQVHGTVVAQLSAATPDGAVADASCTTQRGLACTVMVADCLPVLFTTAGGTAVAAAHAGWRGLVGANASGDVSEHGVLETTINQLKALNQPMTSLISAESALEVIAWLGPCIGPTAFEVGADVVAAFEQRQLVSQKYFTPTGSGKFLADLAGLARARLGALGVAQIYGNDSTAAWCTVGNPSRFFSHRRDASGNRASALHTTGRMAACIWLS